VTLHKATLQEVSPKASQRPELVGSPVSVQVNPTTLRLALANNTDVGKAVGRPNTQAQGLYSSTLSFDLMFDTADQGTTEAPTDVRTLTAQLEYYLLPKKGTTKAVPPRLKFVYGSLEVVGVMSALNLEFDLFADSGIPLRAKASVTIKEQKPEFDADLLGAGANNGAAAANPVPSPGGAGPTPSPDRTGTALGGESAADFATRMGLDPSAWKDLAGGLTDPLRLDAGLQIDFSASLSASVGLGVTLGATAGGAPPGGGGGGVGGGGVTGPAGPDPTDPAAVTAAGGISQALAQQTATRSAGAAGASRAAFPAPAATVAVGAPNPPTGPSVVAAPVAAAQGVSPVPMVPVDPRAASYGFGIPLRPLVAVPDRAAVALVHDRARGEVWPPADAVGSAASSATASSLAGCGCGGGSGASGGCGCGCGGGH
jgi:hypothetical protein